MGNPWCFEFIAGPFDGHRVNCVPHDFCKPTEPPPPPEPPPPTLHIWETTTGTCVRKTGAADLDPSAETYGLDDVDLAHNRAFYIWAGVPEDQRDQLREDRKAVTA